MTSTKTVIRKGKIVGFHGNWMSGMAMLRLVGDDGVEESVPCDNGCTVRALNAAFGDVIGNGHTVKQDGGHVGQVVYYAMDDLGLCLAGFVPEAEASMELVEAYEEERSRREPPRAWWEKAEDLRCDCGSDKPLVNAEAGNVPGTRLCVDCGKAWLVASDGESMTALNNGEEEG